MAAPTVAAIERIAIPSDDGFAHTRPTRWAGVSPFSVSISGASGSPQYRIFDPFVGAGEWSNWINAGVASTVEGAILTAAIVISDIAGAALSESSDSAAVDISEQGHQIQFRATSDDEAGETVTVAWTIGGQSGEWDITTLPATWNAGQPFAPTSLDGRGTTHYISTAVTTFDATAVNPGDTIILRGGTRGKLRIDNLAGTAESPILVTNEPGAARVVMEANSGHLFQFFGAEHFILDGLQEYVGATPGQINYGILVSVNGATTSCVKGKLVCHDYTIRGIEIDGNWTAGVSADNAMGGIGFQLHDADMTAAANPGASYENIVYEYNYAHHLNGEGYYAGQNKNNAGQDPVPIKNLTIRHNVCEDTGREGINSKFGVGGTVRVHDNVVRRTGQRAAFDSTEFDQKAAIGLLFSFHNLDVYNNKVYDAGTIGIRMRSAALTADATDPPEETMDYTARVWNNLVVRTGVEWSATYDNGNTAATDCFGVDVYATALAGRTLTALIANNTLVDVLHEAVSIGTNINASTIRDNLLINCGSALTVHASSGTPTQAGTISATLADDDTTVVTLYDETGDGDYTVAAGTPSILNAASTSAFPTDDIEGNARPFGAASDVGAYERQS